VFHVADSLVIEVYRATAAFPSAERDGLRPQLRRAVISIAANIVEGSARRSKADYSRFLDIALGSATEADYLLDVSHRLGLMPADAYARCKSSSSHVLRGLQKLIDALARLEP
jgi:four helix bundle protein